MKLVAGPILGLTALALAACGISAGNVVGKDYEEPYTAYYLQCFGYDSKGLCTVWMPMPDYIPECWRLDLQQGEDTGSVCVDRLAWDASKIGDYFEEA